MLCVMFCEQHCQIVIMKNLVFPALVGFLVLTGLPLNAGEPTVNPTGTWELKTPSPKSQPATPQILKLKLEDGKLTGTLSRNAGSKVEQLPLEDAKLEGAQISFAIHVYALSYENNVLQPTDTNKVTQSKYQGQIGGDSIKGKVEKKVVA